MTTPARGDAPEPSFARSTRLNARLHEVVPGGAHTYAKGDDQYPAGMAPVISHGRGAHVWDVDGNRYVEYGSGLRAVGLGHAHPRVTEAARAAMDEGANFVRPSLREARAAEELLAVLPRADMVKFAKNGSDATTAAVRLARAVTGRDRVAICRDHPFFSTDDWFVGRSAMAAGVPEDVRALTVDFPFDDLPAVEELFARHPGEIACVVTEPAAAVEPSPGYLSRLRRLCDAHGVLLVLDEMITGFRWRAGGAQDLYGVTPDLSCFGKALGNGFSVAALAGRREVMERGGTRQDDERVFLLSTTHGAESHALAAAQAVLATYREEPVVETLYARGERLAAGVGKVTAEAGVADHLFVSGRPCNLVYVTLDAGGRRSQAFRTLFLQELLRRGVLGMSFVPSAALSEADVDHTVEAVGEACEVYRRALEDGPERHLAGRPVRPALRRFA